jgi:hypothetical protein
MVSGSLESARLAFKRAFLAYYVELNSLAITDPTEAFAACHLYLDILRRQLGDEEFMRRLDDETTHLAGQAEQDLRQRFRDQVAQPSSEDLEARLRECFDYGLAGLRGATVRIPLE